MPLKKNKELHPHSNIETPLLHFSFLKDIKVHGIYFSSITRFLNQYPVTKKEHYHDFYIILHITSGEGSLKTCQETYDVKQNSICLIAPCQVHSLEGLEKTEGSLFFFCQDYYVEEFSFIRLLNLFSYTHGGERQRYSPCLGLSENGNIPAILNAIQGEYEAYAPEKNSAAIMRSQLNILLLRLSDLFSERSGKSDNNDSHIIHELSHLVESYFIKEHQISFYATAFNISEKHMNEICNRHFNCGLKKILQDRLLQESRKLLLYSELSVAEIAYKLNYEDNSYFNKVFKNSTGITPKKFRELHKKLIP